MCCHHVCVTVVSKVISLISDRQPSLPGSDMQNPHGKPAASHSVWTMLRPVVWSTRPKCYLSDIGCGTYAIFQMYGIKSLYVDSPQQKFLLAARCYVVDSLVLKASTNTSSWIFQEYLPEYHSSDGQAKVNMKSLEQSLARCLNPTRHAIDFSATKLHTVAYTGLRALSVSPRGPYNL